MAPGPLRNRTGAEFASYLTTPMTDTVIVFIWVGLSAIRSPARCHVRGLAFDIADIIVVNIGPSVTITASRLLDHGVFAEEHAEEYEEVIAFLEGPSSFAA